MFDTIIDFVFHLNTCEFSILEDDIVRFFKMFSDCDSLECENLISIFKFCFCKNRTQSEVISDMFLDFVKNRKKVLKNKNKKKEKEELKKRLESELSLHQKKLEYLDKYIQEETKKLQNEVEYNFLTKKDKNFLDNNKSFFKKINGDVSKLVNSILETSDFSNFNNFYKTCISCSEKCLSKNDVEGFKKLNQLFKLAQKYEDFLKNYNKLKQKEIKKQLNKEFMERSELSKLVNKHNSQLSQLDEDIKKIFKEESTVHRDTFIPYGNFVVSTSKGETTILDKNLKQLSEQEQALIHNYIKKNILKFKTRLNKLINVKNKNIVNMEDTIKNACKFGGVPIELLYNKPKRNKTKLVLILDISGSCSKYSKMMLSFIHLLSSVFPRGCKSFVFVNELFDISEIFEQENILNVAQKVFATVPSKGTYSNYYIPLKTLWEKHSALFNKDSIVIFMGDARNNQNKPGLDYLKNISRKSKKCFFLNTEEYEKWGHQDSLAFEYSKFCKMFEILSATDIINFLNRM